MISRSQQYSAFVQNSDGTSSRTGGAEVEMSYIVTRYSFHIRLSCLLVIAELVRYSPNAIRSANFAVSTNSGCCAASEAMRNAPIRAKFWLSPWRLVIVTELTL